MKRLLACLLALLLLCGLWGCTAQPAMTVGLVTASGGVAGDALSSALWRGLQDLAAQDNSLLLQLKEPAPGGYENAIAAMKAQGAALIVCAGEPAAKAVQAAAQADPDQRFLYFGATVIDLPNVACPVFDRVQAAYLAGAAAGKLTESDIVCCMQGRFTADNLPQALAFAAGVCSVNSKAAVFRRTTFGDSDGGAGDATDLVSRGVDVIYHAEDTANSAVIRACSTHDIWALGDYYDRSALAQDNVAGSAVNRVDVALRELVQSARTNTFPGGAVRYGAVNGGIALQLQEVPNSVKTAVNNALTRLREGTAFLPDTVEALREKYPDAKFYYE